MFDFNILNSKSPKALKAASESDAVFLLSLIPLLVAIAACYRVRAEVLSN